MTTDRAQLDGKRHWQIVSGMVVLVVAYLVWDTTQNLPQAELDAAVNATPMWQWAPAVIVIAVIVAYIYPLPRVKDTNE